MNKLNKKYKIVIVTIITILFSVITYYIYANTDDEEIISDNEVLVQNSTDDVEKQIKENEVIDNKVNTIIVHIDGCVSKPGVIELKENSRISDAIEKAGGTTKDADISEINLAFLLEDGMKVYIPSHNDKKEENSMEDNYKDINSYVTSDSGVQSIESNINTKSSSNSNKSNSKKSSNAKVNINTATQSELENLPGIGEATALKVINYRNENGKFSAIEDIKNVKGIGDSKFEKIKDLICVK